jgi:hypothetical protein
VKPQQESSNICERRLFRGVAPRHRPLLNRVLLASEFSGESDNKSRVARSLWSLEA